LAVSSNTETVHLFSISPPTSSDKQDLLKSGIELLNNFKNYLSLSYSKSIGKLHLNDLECKWTTKESMMVGPMVSFSKDLAKLVKCNNK